MGSDRVRLGTALAARADEIAQRVLVRVWPDGTGAVDPTAVEVVLAADRAGTRMMAEWLLTGDSISEADRAVFSSLGGLVDRLDLGALTKAFLLWRDELTAVVHEEAQRLGTDPALVAEVCAIVARNNDGSLVRMARTFDEERRRLHSALEAERAKLAQLATHDALTGLPNRVLLLDRVQHAIMVGRRADRPLALLFVDLDGFKQVNDRYGHATGDEVLVAVAARLCETVREADTLARLGGDEFVVVCEDLEDPPAEIAGRIIEALERPFVIGGGTVVELSASIGIANAELGDAPCELIERADLAMYEAKQAGRGRFAAAA